MNGHNNQTAAPIIKPRKLNLGDTIGIFTPSWPAHTILKEKYQHALSQVKEAGFHPIEGKITARGIDEGYRSASPQERADEFMALILDPHVNCLMATIGGSNSASLIPYLDFDLIRKSRKIICGYSDITSLHLAILKYSGLSTLYGPSLVPVFGEYPQILPYAFESFWSVASGSLVHKNIEPPAVYSKHFIDATHPQWKDVQRNYLDNEGWNVLIPGTGTGPLVIADLETLVAAAGTSCFPDLHGSLLVLEEMDAPFSKEERNFRQLEQMGIFDHLSGLLISKPFNPDPEGAPFTYEELIQEVVGRRDYPIISNFDCGHTFPSLTLPIGIRASIEASSSGNVAFSLNEPAVEINPK